MRNAPLVMLSAVCMVVGAIHVTSLPAPAQVRVPIGPMPTPPQKLPVPGTAPARTSAPAGTTLPSLPPGVDAVKVEALIKQLGAEKWKDRQDAQEKLKQLGSDIAPLLLAHLLDDDREIATRIRAVLEAFPWLVRGVMVVDVTPGLPAAKGGVREGDILVGINDVSIATMEDMNRAPALGQRTYRFRRDGQELSVAVADGIFGMRCVYWDSAKTSKEYIFALSRFNSGRRTEALPLLLTAAEQYPKDPHVLIRLAMIMEGQLQHAKAMEYYQRCVDAGGDPVGMTNGDQGLWVRDAFALHLDFIIRQRGKGKMDPRMRSHMEGWPASFSTILA